MLVDSLSDCLGIFFLLFAFVCFRLFVILLGNDFFRSITVMSDFDMLVSTS